MNQNSNIVVDLELWVTWLDALHDAFPEHYRDPLQALHGFHDDWEDYLHILDKIQGVK